MQAVIWTAIVLEDVMLKAIDGMRKPTQKQVAMHAARGHIVRGMDFEGRAFWSNGEILVWEKLPDASVPAGMDFARKQVHTNAGLLIERVIRGEGKVDATVNTEVKSIVSHQAVKVTRVTPTLPAFRSYLRDSYAIQVMYYQYIARQWPDAVTQLDQVRDLVYFANGSLVAIIAPLQEASNDIS